jgi:hypothetical protein
LARTLLETGVGRLRGVFESSERSAGVSPAVAPASEAVKK